jgi:hypothetical protein
MRPLWTTRNAAVIAAGSAKAASAAAAIFVPSAIAGAGSIGSGLSPIGQGCVPASGSRVRTATGVKWIPGASGFWMMQP